MSWGDDKESPFRLPAPLEPIDFNTSREPEPHKTGPVTTCPYCGEHNAGGAYGGKYVSEPLACTPSHRRRFGFLWLRKCVVPGSHTHQHCTKCGTRWVRAMGDEVFD